VLEKPPKVTNLLTNKDFSPPLSASLLFLPLVDQFFWQQSSRFRQIGCVGKATKSYKLVNK